jgi:hypothetical protein
MKETLEELRESSIRMKTRCNSGMSIKEIYYNIPKTSCSRLKNNPLLQDYSRNKNYNLVLACEPEAGDNYNFYEQIIRLVERKNLEIYAPHKDKRDDRINFMINEAIPETKGVLVHLNPLTPDVRELFIATCENKKPFIIIYSTDNFPFNKNVEHEIKSSHNLLSEIKYYSEENAIKLLEKEIEYLLNYERL